MRRTPFLTSHTNVTPIKIGALLSTVFGNNIPARLARDLYTVFLAEKMCFMKMYENAACIGPRAFIFGSDANRLFQEHLINTANQAIYGPVGGGQTPRNTPTERVRPMTKEEKEEIEAQVQRPATVGGGQTLPEDRYPLFSAQRNPAEETSHNDFGMELGNR